MVSDRGRKIVTTGNRKVAGEDGELWRYEGSVGEGESKEMSRRLQ